MTSRREQRRPVRLEEYREPDFLVDSVALEFDLDPDDTRVVNRMRLRRRPGAAADAPLWLDGEALRLERLALDGRALGPGAYRLEAGGLRIEAVPDAFELEVVTRIEPARNTALEGLYVSGPVLCTQCEAEGFRRITYYPDRPDVSARFTVTLRADKRRYPVLLSNGNPDGAGELDGGRHWARWVDPFPKPSYLFALVAGDLACVEDRFVTASGRPVGLRLYVQRHNLGKCAHAMASLKAAMRWDERRYGLEYDLDLYMIVAVDDFNMGAMENKGLNLFNAKYVLADEATATDDDFRHIEAVVGHEYFHNWTGNRVTLRDWFQLSLKEGLTVFREQQFSADHSGGAIQRIEDVRRLRATQFPEDAGPTAHPVQPREYLEINNFYTATVYEKGAEVVRMLHTLLGEAAFVRGLRTYLARHDGGAATIEDFLAAMAEAAPYDVERFRRWYTQAGTPRLRVRAHYDAAARRYRLEFEQHCPPTPGQPEKAPFLIPVAVGLLGPDGASLPLRCADGRSAPETLVVCLDGARGAVEFLDVPAPAVPALLRGFSAPVILEFDYTPEQLHHLMRHEPDPFCRWEAGQRVFEAAIGRALAEPAAVLDRALEDSLAAWLDGELAEHSPELLAALLCPPDEAHLAERFTPADPPALHAAREALLEAVGVALADRFRLLYDALAADDPAARTSRAIGRRALKNRCLAYLAAGGSTDAMELCVIQYRHAGNMTDRLAALRLIADRGGALADTVLEDFRRRWGDDPLVLDKWFAVQASAKAPGAYERVRALLADPAFNPRNPNRVRAVLGAFAQGNPAQFHAPDGRAYRLLAEQVVRLDASNPQLAARLVQPLTTFARLVEPQRSLAREALVWIQARGEALSPDVFELVDKALAAA